MHTFSLHYSLPIFFYLAQCYVDNPKILYYSRFGSITLDDREFQFSQAKLEISSFRAVNEEKWRSGSTPAQGTIVTRHAHPQREDGMNDSLGISSFKKSCYQLQVRRKTPNKYLPVGDTCDAVTPPSPRDEGATDYSR